MALIERADAQGVCRLTISRPERRNAWTAACAAEIGVHLRDLRADAEAGSPSARAVLLTGAGESFCAGVDLRDGFELDHNGVPDLRGMHRRYFAPIIADLRSLPLPVVAAVNGPAIGFGAGLALAADFTLMSNEAYLLMAFVRLGLSVDSGGTLFLPSRAGRARALEATMLGEPIPAAKAEEWGLIHRAVPYAELEAAAGALAVKLAAGPTRAYAIIKRTVDASATNSLTDQLELEGDLIQTLADTADFAEGQAAFAERRAARFEGR